MQPVVFMKVSEELKLLLADAAEKCRESGDDEIDLVHLFMALADREMKNCS